jgi:hypothetical protein
MCLNWLFANRISRRPVATWEDCVDPASLRTTGLQSRGDVGICALMRGGRAPTAPECRLQRRSRRSCEFLVHVPVCCACCPRPARRVRRVTPRAAGARCPDHRARGMGSGVVHRGMSPLLISDRAVRPEKFAEACLFSGRGEYHSSSLQLRAGGFRRQQADRLSACTRPSGPYSLGVIFLDERVSHVP